MRKFKLLFGSVILALVLTGCGSSGKTLTCEMELGDIKMEYALTFNKSGENLKKIKLVTDIKYDDTDELDEEYNEAKEECDESKKEKGVSCSVSKTKDSIKATVNINLSQASESVLSEFDFEEFQSMTYDEMKEQGGDSCK